MTETNWYVLFLPVDMLFDEREVFCPGDNNYFLSIHISDIADQRWANALGHWLQKKIHGHALNPITLKMLVKCQ